MQDNNDSESVYSLRESVCESVCENENEDEDFARTPFEEILCSFKPPKEVEVNKSQTLAEGEKENQMVFV